MSSGVEEKDGNGEQALVALAARGPGGVERMRSCWLQLELMLWQHEPVVVVRCTLPRSKGTSRCCGRWLVWVPTAIRPTRLV
jgi:hypothetical protein